MNSPLNILLAEDERLVAFSISFALKADGYKIEVVSDGEDALSEVTRNPGAFEVLKEKVFPKLIQQHRFHVQFTRLFRAQ